MKKNEIDSIKEQLQQLQDRLDGLEKEKAFPNMIPIPDRDYCVSETMITVGQFREYCNDTGISMPNQPKPHHDNNPVTNVSWHAANDYINWLSKRTGTEYFLPSEDEYEHFCGDHREGNEKIAVFDQRQICKVGTKEPNNFGLYDVLGLAWEWTRSKYIVNEEKS